MIKRNLLAYGFIGGFALLLSLGSQPAKADNLFQQGLQQGLDLLQRHGSDIYHNVVSPHVMQYWAYTISSDEVQRIKNQFQGAAGGEFQNICMQHSNEGDAGRHALGAIMNSPANFYLVQWREENGVVNCYRRIQR